MSSTAPIPVSNILRSSNSDAAKQDLWEQAWNTLNIEDQKQYGDSTSGILDILKNVCNGSWIMRAYIDSAARNIQVKPADVRPLNKVQEATESKKKLCVAKGWRVYRNKHGEEVKLRHVLEKISVWVKGIIKVIDVGVSLDQSGHAALPWTVVKYLTTVGKHATKIEIY